jgi:hypothetical protein
VTSNASESVEIDMGELVEGTLTMTVNIVGTRRFRVRLFIALQLMRIVSWIAPFKVEMEIEE